jgi:hypothetical protein
MGKLKFDLKYKYFEISEKAWPFGLPFLSSPIGLNKILSFKLFSMKTEKSFIHLGWITAIYNI